VLLDLNPAAAPTRLDPEQVAAYLGLPMPDERCREVTASAEAWAQKRRCLTDPAALWVEPDVILGTVMLAALWYAERAQPQGFPGVNDLGNYSDDVGNAWANIYRLIGQDPVIA
jgi:hypothetical protein